MFFRENVSQMLRKVKETGLRCVVAIDPTDPDNFALVVGAVVTFGVDAVAVVLTGRCAIAPEMITRRVAEGRDAGVTPMQAVPITEWDPVYSELLKQVSAVRLSKFLGYFGFDGVPIFDGGFAKAPRVPHHLHMEDMRGFGDILDSEEARVRDGSLRLLHARSAFSAWAQDRSFVVLLGGPATGVVQLFEAEPRLRTQVTGIYMQYGSLGGVKGMQFEGRSERAQFNVLLDADAGVRLLNICRQDRIPCYFLPSDVTRRPEIGLGIPSLGEGILESDHVGFLELQVLRTIWYEKAIRPRAGELLLDHDLACLFMFLQTVGVIQPIYEVHQTVPSIFTSGVDEGVMGWNFELAQDSCFWVATELLNASLYHQALNRVIRNVESRYGYQIVLSGSLAPADMADPGIVRRFESRIIEQLLPKLRAGATVHWGSHPSTMRVMSRLAKLFPGSLHQHLWDKFPESRVDGLPDEQVSMYPSLMDLVVGMVPGKDEGLFVAGRLDLESAEQRRSGVLFEYRCFTLFNEGPAVLDGSLGGMAAQIQIGKTLEQLATSFPNEASFLALVPKC
jgi:hypothetical protein